MKLLTTAIALTLATAMVPAFGQVTQEEKSKQIKEQAKGEPVKKGEPAKAGAVTTAEKSKEGKEVTVPSAKVGEKGKATDPVSQAEKSKVVK